MIEEFKKYLEDEAKSLGTIEMYLENVSSYIKWYSDSYGSEFEKLYRPNILEYKSYLKNIRVLNAKTINTKLSALIKFNEFLQPENIVIIKKDFIKVQSKVANPAIVSKIEVESFRQKVLEGDGSRNFAIVTLLAYAGLRISEALNLKINDINLISMEVIVRSGKGDKQRIVYINDKIRDAVRGYMKDRKDRKDLSYLFLSRNGDRLDRTTINKVFNKYSDKITPHTLRHFFCSHALESGYSVHEVANQAGHSNINTTLLYTNPSIEKMKQKANQL